MMKRLLHPTLCIALASLCATAPASARVVRPAPDFTVAGGKTTKSLRGQPLVILVAPSPESKEFRKQVKKLEKEYDRFSAQGAIFIAAFTQSQGEGLRSSIPFAIAANGAEVAARYGIAGSFQLLVVGIDGNIDLSTQEVSGAYKVRDAILNNYQRQAAARRTQG